MRAANCLIILVNREPHKNVEIKFDVNPKWNVVQLRKNQFEDKNLAI